MDYPCPDCRREGREQTEHRVARVWMAPGAIGYLQCPEHWKYICGPTEHDAARTVPFVLEQPNAEADALKRIIAAWDVFGCSTESRSSCENLKALFHVLRSVASEFGFSGEGGVE